MSTLTLNGSAVHLHEVEREDDLAIIGVNSSGKRFVTRADRVGADTPAAPEFPPYGSGRGYHPYRVYLRNGEVLRVVQPAFGEIEPWFLGEKDGEIEKITVVMPDGMGTRTIDRDEVLSLLSARPEDEVAAREAHDLAKQHSQGIE